MKTIMAIIGTIIFATILIGCESGKPKEIRDVGLGIYKAELVSVIRLQDECGDFILVNVPDTTLKIGTGSVFVRVFYENGDKIIKIVR